MLVHYHLIRKPTGACGRKDTETEEKEVSPPVEMLLSLSPPVSPLSRSSSLQPTSLGERVRRMRRTLVRLGASVFFFATTIFFRRQILDVGQCGGNNFARDDSYLPSENAAHWFPVPSRRISPAVDRPVFAKVLDFSAEITVRF